MRLAAALLKFLHSNVARMLCHATCVGVFKLFLRIREGMTGYKHVVYLNVYTGTQCCVSGVSSSSVASLYQSALHHAACVMCVWLLSTDYMFAVSYIL